MTSTDSVKVAVRIRPQFDRERGVCQVCTVASKTAAQVFIGSEKSFTYDYVFDQESNQVNIYDSCVKELVGGIFNGLNATVLAYGQTGSGKTYTVGTAFGVEAVQPEFLGIIPRAVAQIFETILSLKKQANETNGSEPAFTINVQFIELYNDELIDLLSSNRSSDIRIQENPDTGEIVIRNATTIPVSNSNELLDALRTGARGRTTASTKVNEQSSRSHAIFSIYIKQQKLETVGGDQVLTTLSAKLHFVDLAGSERLKKTGAVGDRIKEGIHINSGLLTLGNVISALTDSKKSHIPYRDSKLTRLLQDSLGGNSRTLMIACVSPNDSNYGETLNTFIYAARAKEIKNRVKVNKDDGPTLVNQLKAQIIELETELEEYRQGKRERPVNEAEMDLVDTYQKTANTVLKEFKRRVDGTLNNEPISASLVVAQQELLTLTDTFKNGLESHLHVLHVPSYAKSRRTRRDTIFDSGRTRSGTTKKRVTTLFSVPDINSDQDNAENVPNDLTGEEKIAALQREVAMYKNRAEQLEVECKRVGEKADSTINHLKQSMSSLKQELMDAINNE